MTDANMNVTTLVDTSGDAVERYVYDACSPLSKSSWLRAGLRPVRRRVKTSTNRRIRPWSLRLVLARPPRSRRRSTCSTDCPGEVTIWDSDWSSAQSAETYSNTILFAGYWCGGVGILPDAEPRSPDRCAAIRGLAGTRHRGGTPSIHAAGELPRRLARPLVAGATRDR